MFADAVTDFAKPDAARTRAARSDHQGADPAVWKSMADMGWLAVVVPEDHGGLGLGIDAACTIARGLGQGGYHDPYVAGAVVAATVLAECGDADGLATLLAGDTPVTLAWQPDEGDWSPADTAVRASTEGKDVRLDGVCRYVVAPHAGLLLVAARHGDDLLVCRVPARAPGVTVDTERVADGTVLGRIRFDKVPATAVIARGETAARALDLAFARGVIACAAELLGVVEQAFDLTTEFLKIREQFGKPIGSFQALQHRAVDMWMQKELTAAALVASLGVFDDPAADANALAAAASSVKARAGQAAQFVGGQSVQLHGAIGFTEEYPLGVWVNRAITLAARYGNAAWHRRRYADLTPVTERS